MRWNVAHVKYLINNMSFAIIITNTRQHRQQVLKGCFGRTCNPCLAKGAGRASLAGGGRWIMGPWRPRLAADGSSVRGRLGWHEGREAGAKRPLDRWSVDASAGTA